RWHQSVTFDEVLAYFLEVQHLKGKGIDLHRLAGIRFTSRGESFTYGTWVRQISKWTGRRTDRREQVRGVVTIDIDDEPWNNYYGDEGFSRVAPAKSWARMASTLLFIQNKIIYKPFR